MGKRKNTEIVYGRRTVLEVLKSRPVVRTVYLAAGTRRSGLESISRAADERRVRMQEVNRDRLDRLCGTSYHQGVAVEADSRPLIDFRQWRRDGFGDNGQKTGPPTVLLLDGVTDPRNLGAILRTADAAAVDAVIIPRRRSSHLTPVVHKVASGACEYLTLVSAPNAGSAIQALKKGGFWIMGLDPEGSGLHCEEDLLIPLVLVLGSEGRGLSRLVRERCDLLVKLPMLGRVDSLNVSVAAGIILYEVVRQKMSQSK